MNKSDLELTAKNLRRLSDFMLELASDPIKQLDQSDYFSTPLGEPVDEGAVYQKPRGKKLVSGHWCGTSACTLGWATVMDPPIESDFYEHGDFDMRAFEDRLFPVFSDQTRGFDLGRRVFDSELSDSFTDSAERCKALALALELEAQA